MPGVLMNALIRIGAHLPGINQAKSAPRLQPLVEQVPHEQFAELDLRRLVEPGLRHVQDQKAAGDEAEAHELDKKLVKIFVR